MRPSDLIEIQDRAAEFTMRNRVDDTFQFRMSDGGNVTFYSSIFAVMILHYTGRLNGFSYNDKKRWADYINSFQDCNTGVYRAPEIFEGKIEGGGHDEEHLSLHLLAHVLPALDLLGSSPNFPLVFADRFCDVEFLKQWLSVRDWRKAWLEGNNLLFVGQILVYMWETGKPNSAEALEFLMNWLDESVDIETGLWGTNGFCGKYVAVYGGYHQLILYNYLRRPIISPDRLLDTVLSIQHIDGGYSRWHGGGTCQDVDAIDILVNLYKIKDYKRRQIRRSLRRSYSAVCSRINVDGGFCDRRGHEFIHMGMELTRTEADKSNMFSTWFGVHSIALIFEIFKYDFPRDFDYFEKSLFFNESCSMGWHRKSPINLFKPSGLVERVTDLLIVGLQKMIVTCHKVKKIVLDGVFGI